MEENKVAQKLIAIMRKTLADYGRGEPCFNTYAQAILQSPDLRVALVEPQYKVWHSINSPNPHVVDNRTGGAICEFYESAGYAERNAQHLADWLNSKEPK